MENLNNDHQFHIPVMGTAFTIDTPIKVARFGISSVISLCDDELCENMRQYYSGVFDIEYTEISKKVDDFRAKRITAYLNVVNEIVNRQIAEMKQQSFEEASDLVKYFECLPETSDATVLYKILQKTMNTEERARIKEQLLGFVKPGSIDVNIMTKLDRDTYDKNAEKRETMYSDALSALRGFAESDLEASIVFSAGFNRRLYGYIDQFDDFFPDSTGFLKKKVILKVSDYRSSLTQGKFLAKKGVWVSEYRIESGLNCGGHAFASDGYLLGPILEEFKQNKTDLVSSLFVTCNKVLEQKRDISFSIFPEVDITVQGGIGTYNEHNFLLQYYNLKRTGWATPFLLVPEVTIVDDETRQLLSKAEEDDLYLSGVSPLGVPFNSVRGTESEKQKMERFENGKPGSPCPKGYLVSNTEFSKKPVCTASVFFQKRKIEQLKALSLSSEALKNAVSKVVEKVCLCEDLAASALLSNNIENKRPLKTAVCAGPNLAYFSRLSSLKDMVGHIYGRIQLLNNKYRPNLFVSELKMYVNYFSKEIQKLKDEPTQLDIKYLNRFRDNLNDGIQYYHDLVPKLVNETVKYKVKMKEELETLTSELDEMVNSSSHLFSVPVAAVS
ncbi:hypothetical protein DID78_04045 [Candidatus Marinamargulisbacteria bacterium SCGC AG-343-D04]|nr:hypothetical protein DID78_04045 [Candidatus Marinamargulisbacteria bacterium SCGC AG-343-D04]